MGSGKASVEVTSGKGQQRPNREKKKIREQSLKGRGGMKLQKGQRPGSCPSLKRSEGVMVHLLQTLRPQNAPRFLFCP